MARDRTICIELQVMTDVEDRDAFDLMHEWFPYLENLPGVEVRDIRIHEATTRLRKAVV